MRSGCAYSFGSIAQPDIHAATGFVVESPLDEVNRPRGGTSSRLRVPPSDREIETLFTGWRADMATARKYAPAARNYTAMRLASLIGPRVSELCLLTTGDVRWDLGRFGKVLLHGKGGKQRRGPVGSFAAISWIPGLFRCIQIARNWCLRIGFPYSSDATSLIRASPLPSDTTSAFAHGVSLSPVKN